MSSTIQNQTALKFQQRRIRANSGGVPSPAWWVGRIQEDSRRHQFLSFVGRRAPNRWSLIMSCYKSQTADLFTIHSANYFEEVMTHHMLKLPVLHFRWRKGDRIQKSGFLNFLCALLVSFSSLSTLYISVTNSCLLIFFFWRLYLLNSRSFSLTLALYHDSFYFLFVPNIFSFIGAVWWKIFVFLTRKKKRYPDLYVSLYYLSFRIELENQTRRWLQTVYIQSGLNSLWFSRELGSNYKHRGSMT